MKAAFGALVVATLFLTGVLVGLGFENEEKASVARIELVGTALSLREQPQAIASQPSEASSPSVTAPKPPIKFEKVEREVEQAPLEEYGPNYVENDEERNNEGDRSGEGSGSGSGSGDTLPSPSPSPAKSLLETEIHDSSGADDD